MARILIVDDMAIVREPIAAALRANGYETMTAENGREALHTLRSTAADVVLLDFTMPVMDGLAFLKALRADPHLRETHVIPLTVAADRASVLAAARLGVKRYIVKTHFSMSDLFAAIAAVLDDPANIADPQAHADDTDPKTGATSSAPQPIRIDTGADPAEALGSLKSMLTRSQVLERIEENAELRGLSATTSQVVMMTQNEGVSIEKIASVIKQDYAIAIKVLRIANSSVYSRGKPVDTVDRAVTRLGLSQVRQVVLNLAVMERFASAEICGRVTGGQFWEHSLACGLIASEITQARGGSTEDADRAFTMGLVHDLGRTMFATALSDEYEAVMQTAEEHGLPLEQVESRLLILNHADVMDRLLHRWRFPKELIDPIVFHHLSLDGIRQSAPKRFDETATLALADRLCHALVLGSSGNVTLYPTHDLCEALSLDAETLRRIEETARDETTDLKLGLLSHSHDSPWNDQREALHSQLSGPLKPIIASGRPDFDAVRIFFEQIASPEEMPPNLAIAHVTDAQSREEIIGMLERAEREAGVENLVTLVFSNDGRVTLPGAEASGRRCVFLQTPIAMSRLLKVINACLAPEARSQAA